MALFRKNKKQKFGVKGVFMLDRRLVIPIKFTNNLGM